MATWCPPCLEEIPTLDYLGRQLAKKDNKDKPRLVTISIDEKSSDVIQFFKTLDASPQFIVLYDPEGDFATTLGTNKFPETFLIDRTGKVIKKWAGPENWLSGNVLQTLSFNPSK